MLTTVEISVYLLSFLVFLGKHLSCLRMFAVSVTGSIHPGFAVGAEPVPGPRPVHGPGVMFPTLTDGRAGPGAAAWALLLPPSLHLAVGTWAEGPVLSVLLPLVTVLQPAGAFAVALALRLPPTLHLVVGTRAGGPGLSVLLPLVPVL